MRVTKTAMRVTKTAMGVLLLAMTIAPAAFAVEADEAREAFARMDSNRDGQLSLEEFEQGIRRPFGSQGEGVVYQKLPARFRALDADESGYLDAEEYAQLAQRWQAAGEPPAFDVADQGGDGRVDFREFAAVHAPPAAPDAEAPDAETSDAETSDAAPAQGAAATR